MLSHTSHSVEGIKNTEDPKNGTWNIVTSFYNIILQFTLISQKWYSTHSGECHNKNVLRIHGFKMSWTCIT